MMRVERPSGLPILTEVTRFRLRFLLQEVDLRPGTTLLGRGAECSVTIDDSLVSRRHARILIEGNRALIEDLGSRNGVKVNGRAIREPTELEDGDRLRIGLQELVFCHVPLGPGQWAKTTGSSRRCTRCDVPYLKEAAACPNCGAVETRSEDTVTDQLGAAIPRTGNLERFVDALECAIAQQRFEDANHVLKQVTLKMDDWVAGGKEVNLVELARLAEAATHVSRALADPRWVHWVTRVYTALNARMPDRIA